MGNGLEMANFFIQKADTFEATRRLKAGIKRARDLSELYAKIRGEAHKDIFRQLNVGGDPKFKKLSPRYAALKAVTHPGTPILTRSGAMRLDYAKTGVLMGNRLVFFYTSPVQQFHQEGTPRMPVRALRFEKTKAFARTEAKKFITEGFN